MNCWRRQESNPKAVIQDGSTDHDTPSTDTAQNRYCKKDSDRSSLEANGKHATETMHSTDTSDTSFCAPGVPEVALPQAVSAALRNWGRLPEHIRITVETVLKAVERSKGD